MRVQAMTLCPTARGRWRCPLPVNHPGECETRDGEPPQPLVVVPAAESAPQPQPDHCPTCGQEIRR